VYFLQDYLKIIISKLNTNIFSLKFEDFEEIIVDFSDEYVHQNNILIYKQKFLFTPGKIYEYQKLTDTI